eukprot:scaffold199936_cov19-Tisochrysis_lutea.AAC.1
MSSLSCILLGAAFICSTCEPYPSQSVPASVRMPSMLSINAVNAVNSIPSPHSRRSALYHRHLKASLLQQGQPFLQAPGP